MKMDHSMTDHLDQFIQQYLDTAQKVALYSKEYSWNSYCDFRIDRGLIAHGEKVDLSAILPAGVPRLMQPIMDFYMLFNSISEYESGGFLCSLKDAAKTRTAEAGMPRPWPKTPFSFVITYPDDLAGLQYQPLHEHGPILCTAPHPNEDYRAWFNGLSDAARATEMHAIQERTAHEWVAEVRRGLYWQFSLNMGNPASKNTTIPAYRRDRPHDPVHEIVRRYGHREAEPQHWDLSLHEKDKLYNRGSATSDRIFHTLPSAQCG
jgi:hypothetical protein